MEKVVGDALAQSMNYEEYRVLIDRLLAEGKTTGVEQSDDLLHYANLNVTRMKRLDKTTIHSEEIKARIAAITRQQKWLVITEGWCGDAAQIIPVIESMAKQNDAIETRYVLRDEHTELIDRYLTNGGRSIPKVLLIDAETEVVYSTWGPRPEELQAVIDANKASDDPKPYSELSIDVQRWYAKDRTVSIQTEFTSVLS